MTRRAQAEFLDVLLEVESKTQYMIEVCHACDRARSSDEPHEILSRIGEDTGSVVEVSFGRADGA